jgi:chromosome partitioning protein
MIIAIANTKGGVAKTTTALNLGVAATIDGKKVLLVDADNGGSLRSAMKVREGRSEDRERDADDPKRRTDLAFIPSIPMDGPDIDKNLREQAKHYDVVIVDVGGEGQGAMETRKTLLVADRVVVPCVPASAEVVRLEALHGMIRHLRESGLNESLIAHLFPVRANPGAASKDVSTFYKKVAKHGYYLFDYMSAVLRTREAYKTWADDGEGVLEKGNNRDTRDAKTEVRNLYAELGL